MDDRIIVHKGPYHPICPDEITDGDQRQHRQHHLQSKKDGVFHPFPVAGCKGVTDKRHDPLGKAQCDLHGNHIQFVSDTHGSHSIGTMNRCEIIQDSHTCHIQKVLDRCRGTHTADTLYDIFLQTEFPRNDTVESLRTFYVQKYDYSKKISQIVLRS